MNDLMLAPELPPPEIAAPTVCVLGLGYVGLPIAAFLASGGRRVHGVDIHPAVVRRVSEGHGCSLEPGLAQLVTAAVGDSWLTAAEKPVEAEVYLIAVPTPVDASRKPDLSHVLSAASEIAPLLRPGVLVVVESTLPVGGTGRVAEHLASLRPDLTVGGENGVFVACSPERILPGQVVAELGSVHRVVGGIDPASTDQAVAFYRGALACSVTGTDARTAELTKLAENASRDVDLAFANELSLICDELDVDVREVIELANRHPRVDILQPGPGVGGHCVAVDPWFLVHATESPTPLLETARLVNTTKAAWVVEQVVARAGRFKAPVVACLGLSYKPDIADTRESPSLAIAHDLTERIEGQVLCVDPHVGDTPGLRRVEFAEALARADVVVVLVAHAAFRSLDRHLLFGKVVFDTCGAWS